MCVWGGEEEEDVVVIGECFSILDIMVFIVVIGECFSILDIMVFMHADNQAVSIIIHLL